MKPPVFDYIDPGSMVEALEAVGEYGEDGKVLAGGQSLIPLLNMRLAQPSVLIDLNRASDLSYLRQEYRDGRPGVAIGAMTRQRSVEDAGDVLQQLPMLREAISWVGHPQIRNRGTVGGSVAHADPSAELPLLFRALDGVATVQSRHGSRSVPAADFFLYTFTPDIQPDELLSEIWLPLPAARTGQAFLEVARRHGDFALVSAAVSLTLDEHHHCAAAQIAVGGAAPTPIRTPEAEAMLIGQRPSLESFREAGAMAAAGTEPTGDVHADADYRREVAGVLVVRALTLAFERVPKDHS